MLDQETARALLHIADQADARVVFVGDRRQLPAVGRGGVLDMVAALGAHPGRTRRGAPVPHPRRPARHRVRGPHPADPLRDRPRRRCSTTSHQSGHVKVWDTEADALGHLAWDTAHRHLRRGRRRRCRWPPTTTPPRSTRSSGNNSSPPAPSTTPRVTHGSDGLRIGVGDQVMTRQNDPDLGVANRMTWTVTGITDDGERAAAQRGPPAARHRRPRLRAAPPAPGLRDHRARRARRHRRPRRPRAVRRHRRRRRRTSGSPAAGTRTPCTSSPAPSTRPGSSGSPRPAGTAPTSASTRPAPPPPRRPGTTRGRRPADPAPRLAGAAGASFADRMRQVTARLADDQPRRSRPPPSVGRQQRVGRRHRRTPGPRHPDPVRAAPVGSPATSRQETA